MKQTLFFFSQVWTDGSGYKFSTYDSSFILYITQEAKIIHDVSSDDQLSVLAYIRLQSDELESVLLTWN